MMHVKSLSIAHRLMQSQTNTANKGHLSKKVIALKSSGKKLYYLAECRPASCVPSPLHHPLLQSQDYLLALCNESYLHLLQRRKISFAHYEKAMTSALMTTLN
jgi:hypothetical protein